MAQVGNSEVRANRPWGVGRVPKIQRRPHRIGVTVLLALGLPEQLHPLGQRPMGLSEVGMARVGSLSLTSARNT